MLVLSRREKEKVLFPTLGITVEVLRTGSRKVQLGIDAPLDIRVIRDELEYQHCIESRPLTSFEADKTRESLDAARASIVHAKSQIARGSNTHAEQSLQLALSYLHQLEDRLSGTSVTDSTLVRESAPGYEIGPGLTQIINEFVDGLC
jgi:carbon storage regulator CsrA